MRALIAVTLSMAGCALALPERGPLPAPSVEEARALLDEIVDAALERDFDRLCASASGTCEGELEGNDALAPDAPPAVVDVEVYRPVGDADAWTSGGVTFVLCGADAAGDPYESEVLVFDDGERLLAAGAVFWTGTGVSFAPPGEHVTVAEPASRPSRCP